MDYNTTPPMVLMVLIVVIILQENIPLLRRMDQTRWPTIRTKRITMHNNMHS